MELVSLCGAKRRGQAKIKEISKINNQMVTRAVEKSTKRKEEREEQ